MELEQEAFSGWEFFSISISMSCLVSLASSSSGARGFKAVVPTNNPYAQENARHIFALVFAIAVNGGWE